MAQVIRLGRRKVPGTIHRRGFYRVSAMEFDRMGSTCSQRQRRYTATAESAEATRERIEKRGGLFDGARRRIGRSDARIQDEFRDRREIKVVGKQLIRGFSAEYKRELKEDWKPVARPVCEIASKYASVSQIG